MTAPVPPDGEPRRWFVGVSADRPMEIQFTEANGPGGWVQSDDHERAVAAAFAAGRAAATPDPTVSYRVRDRDSDYKAMCHEDRDHAELLLKAWLSDGRDAVIERRHVFDGGWSPVERPFFTEQQERALARCEGYDEGYAASPDERLREAARNMLVALGWDDQTDAARALAAALAAADREKPEER